MQRFKSSSLLLAVVAAAMAQTPGAVKENDAVLHPTVDTRRVGMRLRCKCGCTDSIASCSMLECDHSKTGKERIAKMQALGMDDKQIISAFVQDYGADIYLSEPSAFGWIVPYASVGVGMVAIFLFVKKYRKPHAVAEIGTIEIDDPALEKYKDQIEKDLANME
jgi:cytochrome c-type biogenesis protein CcmH/NrfF